MPVAYNIFMSGAVVLSLYSYNTNGIDNYFSWSDSDRLKLKCSSWWYFDTNTRNITLKRNTFSKFYTIWLQYREFTSKQKKHSPIRKKKSQDFRKDIRIAVDSVCWHRGWNIAAPEFGNGNCWSPPWRLREGSSFCFLKPFLIFSPKVMME